jgi:hypothetical protein
VCVAANVTSIDEYEGLFADKRYAEKDGHIAADLRAWIEGRADGMLLSDRMLDVDRARRRNMLLGAGTRAALAYQRTNRQPIDSLLIIKLATLCIAAGGRCEVSLTRLYAMFQRKRDVMTDAMRRIRNNCRDLQIDEREGETYSVAIRVMPADLYWTGLDLLSAFDPVNTAAVAVERASANPRENSQGYSPARSGGCDINNPPENSQETLRNNPETPSGKLRRDPPEKSGATNRNRDRPIGSAHTAGVDAAIANGRASKSSVGTTSDAPPPDAPISSGPIELPLGELWFVGKHLRIPRTTFEIWCVETPALRERPDIVKNSAKACEERCASGRANRTFSNPLEWFEHNWLPNARTKAIKAVNEVVAAIPKGRLNGARRDVLDGVDPNSFRD